MVAAPREGDVVVGMAADRGVAVCLIDGTSDVGQPVTKLMVMDVSDQLRAGRRRTLEMTVGARAVAQRDHLAAVVSSTPARTAASWCW